MAVAKLLAYAKTEKIKGQSTGEGVVYNDFENNFAKHWLETSWKHLKDVVSSFMVVDECIAAITLYQTSIERDYQMHLFKLAVYEFAATAAQYQYYEALLNIYFI
ncbi:hypothetical protein PybrP1_003048, partial [[Pythium] brassicae (nom. inval.)]